MTTTSRPATAYAPSVDHPPGPARGTDREVVSSRLLASAARTSYDPLVDIDWAAPVPDDLYGLSPEWSSLHGTPLWDGLSHAERVRLTQHEVCSMSGVGIWFELILMQLLVRDVYDDDPAQPHVQFALTEIADECRHSVMFAKMAQRFGCPSYGPSRGSRELGRAFKTLGRGPAAYAAILVAEEILDVFQRDLLHDERVQPLSREVSRIHVIEEARHMRFAREEVVRRAPSLTRVQRAHQRAVLATVALVIVRSLVHPDVYAAVGLDPAVATRAARSNQTYAERLRSAAAPLVGLLRDAGLIGGPSERLWVRAGLL